MITKYKARICDYGIGIVTLSVSNSDSALYQNHRTDFDENFSQVSYHETLNTMFIRVYSIYYITKNFLVFHGYTFQLLGDTPAHLESQICYSCERGMVLKGGGCRGGVGMVLNMLIPVQMSVNNLLIQDIQFYFA